MVSHISRKTSEMWGTQDSFALEVLKTTNNAHPLVYSRVKIPKATAHYSRSYVGRHITGRMEFLVVSFLGHHGTSGDGSALPPRLEQNPPDPSADLPSVARILLSRRPLRSLASDRLAARHPGRPAAGRPYDTASDTDVGGAAVTASRSTGRPPITLIAALGTPRWPWPFLPRPIPSRGLPPDYPSGIRMAGHEHRLHRMAYPPSLRISLAFPGLARGGARLLSGYLFALLASHHPALADGEPRVALGHVALSCRRGPGEYRAVRRAVVFR